MRRHGIWAYHVEPERKEGQDLSDGVILYLGTRIPYKVLRSARKTIAVSVTRDAKVLVRIPEAAPYSEGHLFAEKNCGWIYRNVISLQRQRAAAICWKDGADIQLHGMPRRLRVEARQGTKRSQVTDSGEEITVICDNDSAELVESLVKAWYKEIARIDLTERSARWAARMGVDFAKISIRDQSTRWGSCSAKGNLSYNWKLVLLPEELADYVVVHELAHRKQMNHSKLFWDLVEKELPDYMQRRRKLRGYEVQINTKY